jgi:hypothetical protein
LRSEFDINFISAYECVHGCWATEFNEQDSGCLSDSCLRNCSVLHKIAFRGAAKPEVGGGISSPQMGHLMDTGWWCSSSVKGSAVVVDMDSNPGSSG